MARFTASWTNTEATDWAVNDYVIDTIFRDQIGQNIEFLGQSHDHSGDGGDGATLVAGNLLNIWLYGPPSGDA